MLNIFYYDDAGTRVDVSDLLVLIKYTCSVDKIAQQVDLVLVYGVYSDALPTIYIGPSTKIELYYNGSCIFRGKVITSDLKSNEEQIELTCYDFIWYLTKSKVVYNFSDISAYKAICKIFDDLEIPYNKDGILGGANGEGASININHLIKNKSAYDACMMIATEIHTQTGTFIICLWMLQEMST
ncbi:XkdQ/YqbQ family protein [Clostridium saccharoperbutylacetonicum]|uniref:XkdQ/YqbQ family protein n=1 Tax=Clostridium saccharoperbutylacetonicum TaxID=36745 RepID=UPI001F4D036D|nr:hypothetical protein [Clostridium saccharoperbutylacetonicum]NSB26139.1 hypothetical protein [Clostridium saccharoperbutylacetonicum]